jgi:hypothetical protein
MGKRLVGDHSSTDVAIWTAKVPARPAPPEQQGPQKRPGATSAPGLSLISFFLTFLIAHATRAEDLMTARGHNALTNDAAIGRGISVIIPISVMVTAIPIWTNAGTYWANLYTHTTRVCS